MAQIPNAWPSAPDAHEEAAGLASRRRLLCQRHGGAAGSVEPAVGCVLATFGRQHPTASEPQVASDERDIGVDVVVTDGGPAGFEPRVVVRCGEDVSDPDVARLQTVDPGHPRRGQQGVGTGQVHDLVDRDDPSPRDARDRDGPAPAGVAREQAVEEVSDHPLLVGLDAHVLADQVRSDQLDDGGPRQVDRRSTGSVRAQACRRVRSVGRHRGQPSIWSATARSILVTFAVSAG